VSITGENPRAVVAGDFQADGAEQLDLFAGFEFRTAWYERIPEQCGSFDVCGDEQIDGAELSWLAWAFAWPVTDPPDPIAEWWAPLDYNGDLVIDGDDLAILSSDGVWGRTKDTCQYTCR
jgi:hypothetical protein